LLGQFRRDERACKKSDEPPVAGDAQDEKMDPVELPQKARQSGKITLSRVAGL
jgi:hypothetical protein